MVDVHDEVFLPLSKEKNIVKPFLPSGVIPVLLQNGFRFGIANPLHELREVRKMVIEGLAANSASLANITDRDFGDWFFARISFKDCAIAFFVKFDICLFCMEQSKKKK